MTSTSINSPREQLYQALYQCRLGTLNLFDGMDEVTFCTQFHPDFSPIGWHLGHIALTEAYWLLEYTAGLPPLFPEYKELFRVDGSPKAERGKLPSIAAVRTYLETVREQVWRYLERAPIDQQERLWRFVLQHECQHTETIALGLHLQQQHQRKTSPIFTPVFSATNLSDDMVQISAGAFFQGSDLITALDNEQPRHRVELDTYWIDRYPVTCGQYRQFMEAGGYQNSQWWSAAGWQWLQQASNPHPILKPCYWLGDEQFANYPVCGVSWYEAEAYCNFMGKRLPTEAEWEKAASWVSNTQTQRTYSWGETQPSRSYCNCAIPETFRVRDYQTRTTPVDARPQGASAYGVQDLLGNVWEWTQSRFQGYPGFQAYPYPGYSQTYFDPEHRVLKGGSWATRSWAMRNSFRNWYQPQVRQVLAGFRGARSESQDYQRMTPRQMYLRAKIRGVGLNGLLTN